MKYRELGSTGMITSVVGIGTWQFGGEWGKTFEPTEVRAMFDACRRLGINLIDTAECYGDHSSESLIGQAIKQDRDHWIVATKFGHKFHGFLDRSTDYSAAGMVEQLEASLNALHTDRIDVYQVHSVSQETFDDDELWAELLRQKQRGKIRAIGVSIGHEPMPLGRELVETVQVIHNRLNRGAEDEVPPGVNMSTWALAWCLRHAAVTTVIPGCKSVQQVELNAAAADLDINQVNHPQATAAPSDCSCHE